jgi:polyisoprenoid-binding protein YceI
MKAIASGKNLCALATLLIVLTWMPSAFAQASSADDAHGAYSLNQEHSKILFSISHFVVSSTDGRFSSFDGTLRFDPAAPEHGTVTIHIAPGSISTGIDARDEHLRTADFFDVARFPTATFESTALTRNSDKKGKLTGMLSLHGVSRPIGLDVTHLTADPNADKQLFSATGTLKRSDFGMTNYLSVIGDEVTLTIEAEFDRTH